MPNCNPFVIRLKTFHVVGHTNLNPPALGTTDYPNTPQTLNQIYKIKFDLNFYIMH